MQYLYRMCKHFPVSFAVSIGLSRNYDIIFLCNMEMEMRDMVENINLATTVKQSRDEY